MNDPQGYRKPNEPDVAHLGLLSAMALGMGVLLLVAAGVVGVSMSMSGGSHQMMWGGPEQRAAEEAAPAGFQLDMMPAHLTQHYGFAKANPSVYEQVPCFCGCQDMLGHRNLEDCFVTPDGAWESHASGCQVCIDESRMLMRMMAGGASPDLIRQRIVDQFGSSTMGMSA
jgi:hypothetical protein